MTCIKYGQLMDRNGCGKCNGQRKWVKSCRRKR